MDGKHFPMKNYETGVTAPPFHPNCRTVTAPYFEDNYGGMRAARDKNGKTYYVPDNTTYKDWKKVAVEGEGLTNGANGDTIKESKQKREIRHSLEKANIEYRKGENLTTPLSIDEIISKVGGGDTTNGACSSVAFAYIGNRNRLEVLDFRGGKVWSSLAEQETLKELQSCPV